MESYLYVFSKKCRERPSDKEQGFRVGFQPRPFIISFILSPTSGVSPLQDLTSAVEYKY